MSASRTVRAVLGPTNTGKTHLAIDRMLAYGSGTIGFPLRLLARENYDRIAAEKGVGTVALITGEEKIIPPRPRWFVCTVESMPLDRPVDFLAVDEIQLCADPDRGHIFTDRLLHSRGRTETMFLGADTIRPMIRRLVPEAVVESRPRFSTLAYTGPKKLTRLPRRSAVVGFSVAEVYALAESVRRQRGGAAVVLGALSPRTRNAQVALYQAGEVDYLVATDAIGMGLNMDVNHIAFARRRKFDGRQIRDLRLAEIAQIAGRAGRHMNDGTFGVTNNTEPFDEEMVAAIESHEFEPLTALSWRNRRLDFRSPVHLLRSLERRSDDDCLVRAREADDHLCLRSLARDDATGTRADNPERVRLLWDVCQIPDFRKTMADHHTDLARKIFVHLCDGDGRLPQDWVARQIDRLNNTGGDLDSLTARIAHVRTWAYIAHRGDWLADSAHWQGRARAIEDKLSDALHSRLIQRFVDRRASVLGRKLDDGESLLSAIGTNGRVTVEGHVIGRIQGLRFMPEEPDELTRSRALEAAAAKVIQEDLPRRVRLLQNAPDSEFTMALDALGAPTGEITWRGAIVARLTKGTAPVRPTVALAGDDLADGALRTVVRARIVDWLQGMIAKRLGPLAGETAPDLSPAARGIVFRLAEALGALPRKEAADLLPSLNKDDRQRLRRLGVRLGRATVFAAAWLKPQAMQMRRALWRAWSGRAAPPVPEGDAGICPAGRAGAQAWQALGYRRYGPVAVRVDRVEAILRAAAALARQGPFAPTSAMLRTADGTAETLHRVLSAHGFEATQEITGTVYRAKRQKQGRNGRRRRRKTQGAKPHPDSPFAKLRDLVPAK